MRSRWLHPITQRSPPSVSLAGFVDPGSYLLSRDLSSDNEPDGCKGSWPERSARSPRPAGVRAREAGPKQPEKMVGRTTSTVVNPCTVTTEKPAELSFCGLHLPWQLSTLAGPVVRQDARRL